MSDTPQLTDAAAYRSQVNLNVRYNDLDTYVHVNNGAYLHYLEEARILYATQVLGWDGSWDSFNMIVARIEINYAQPIFLGEAVVVKTRVSKVGGKSFVIDYLILKGKTHETATTLAASARSVMVGYHLPTNQTQPVPERFRAQVRAWEPVLPEGL